MFCKLVIFDFDGVLCDSEKLHKECFINSMKLFGYDWCPLKDRLYNDNKNLQTKKKLEIFSNLGFFKKEDTNEVFLTKQKLTLEKISGSFLEKNVKDFISYNKPSMKFAIASDCNLETIKSFLDNNQALHLFDVLASSSYENLPPKPSPEIYLNVLQKFKISKDELSIAFEDSDEGVRSASSAGISKVFQCTYNSLYDNLLKIF